MTAGVRQPMEQYVAATDGRILEPALMEITQAVGRPRAAVSRRPSPLDQFSD